MAVDERPVTTSWYETRVVRASIGAVSVGVFAIIVAAVLLLARHAHESEQTAIPAGSETPTTAAPTESTPPPSPSSSTPSTPSAAPSETPTAPPAEDTPTGAPVTTASSAASDTTPVEAAPVTTVESPFAEPPVTNPSFNNTRAPNMIASPTVKASNPEAG